MKKKIICFIVFFIGIVSVMPAATNQFFFDLNGGIWFYPGIGGRVGWLRFWNNERIGFIGDVRYRFIFSSAPALAPPPGSVGEDRQVNNYHTIGLAAGVVFNNMGMSGTFRTSQYLKFGGVFDIPNTAGEDNRFSFYPISNPGVIINPGVKISMFFTETTALSAGIGLENIFPYFSLGMTFSRK